MGKIIGLDIGVASVGWSVVENDDTAKVLELGSNIFECADASKNENRRQMRQTRRLLRRKRNRIKDFNKLWIRFGFKINIKKINNQLELRNIGLSKQLTEDELYAVLVNLLKHRGISYLEDSLDEEQKGRSDYQKGLILNQNELNNKLPCQIQLERLNKYNKYRGTTLVKDNNEDISLLNVFNKSSYEKEIELLFECQKEYNNKISNEFIEKYIEIFNRKREYYIGPGNDKSRTDYGKWTTKKDENGNYITEDNIFEKLIGKSSIIIGDETETEKLRASAASYSAQEFNVLNDLNNITIGGRKLTKNEKIKIIDEFKNQTTAVLNYKKIEKIIATIAKEDVDSIKGNRVDREENPEYHSLEIYRFLRNKFNDINIDINMYDREKLDKIAHILTINTEREEIIKRLKKDNIILEDEICNKFADIRINNSKYFSKWHSFSLKVLNRLIPYMYDDSIEQMTLITEQLKEQKLIRNIKNYDYDEKYIDKYSVLSEIYNPVVKRSINITINILNALIKKYNDIDYVVIEMPRDKNEKEEKNRIKDLQKNNEKEIVKIKNKLINEYSITNVDEKLSKIKNLSMKLRLWEEQNETCLYSGTHIDIDDLINNPNNYEIDHIIPISISFDDSRNNKVLVKQIENQKKTNMTPYKYLNNIDREYNYIEFSKLVKKLQKDGKLNKKKVNNLLFEDDINAIDVLKGFIQRNINDTRYASRVILNACQSFFNNKKYKTIVKVIRGSFTSQMRKKLGLNKDRDESYAHHAIDATLICYSQMGYDAYKKLRDNYINIDTGEIINNEKLIQGISEKDYDDIVYNTKWKLRKDNIIEAEKRVKYWHKVDMKVNRQLCNQTIRGTRNIDGVTYKVNYFYIYNTPNTELVKKLIDNKDNLLMYRYDKKTYDNLMLIFNRYSDQTKPFVEAKRNGEMPRKYSKNNDGPEIVKIKYLDGKIDSCIDISHKFGFEKNSKKVILESLNPYRSDFYYNEKLGKYLIAGIRYNDLKCISPNKYIIDKDNYTEILRKEGIIDNNQTIDDINKNGYKFMFSLYKNNYFEYVMCDKDGNENKYVERYLSRTKLNIKGNIEDKPISKSKFIKDDDGIDRKIFVISKAKYIKKITLDILGNRYYVNNEKFIDIIDI